MTNWQTMTVEIRKSDIFSPNEYRRLPSAKIFCNKVDRAIRQYENQGWELEKIDISDGVTTLFLRRLAA